MSVTRINEFRAKDGQAQGLRDFLASIVPTIEASDGCRSCRLMQDLDDETMFVVVEVWDSVETHKASVEGITPEQLEVVTRLLTGPRKVGTSPNRSGEPCDPPPRPLQGVEVWEEHLLQDHRPYYVVSLLLP